MKKLLLTILFFTAALGGLRAQKYLAVTGVVDDTTSNRKIFISYHSTNCFSYDTAKTFNYWGSGYYYKGITIPAGCNYGIIHVKMVDCNGDTIYQRGYFDSTQVNGDTTLYHNFKYCDTCNYISANFSAPNYNLTVNFVNYSSGANRYIWQFHDTTSSAAANPTKVYSAFGNYNVCLIAIDTVTGCTDTFCKSINVRPPCYNFGAAFYPSINNKTVVFSNFSTYRANKFTWDFGDSTSSSAKNPVHVYTTYGNRDVCLIARDTINNCADTVCANIKIINPCAGFKAGFIDSVNHSTKTVKFTDTSKGTITKSLWSFGDTGTSAVKNPTHAYGSYGTYNVCLVVTDTVNGCKDSVCRNVVITNPCTGFTAGFTDSDSGWKVTFTNTSSANANKFNWTFGNSATSTVKNPIYTYGANGTYNVCLVARDTVSGCKDSVCKNVTVFSCGSFSTSVFFTDSFVTGTYYYTAQSPSNANKFLWDFGDSTTSTAKNPVHTFSSPGVYIVCLYVWDTINGCTAGVCKVTYVNNYSCTKFNAAFGVTPNQLSPSLMNFSSPQANWFHWDFGDGNSSSAQQPGSHTYSSAGTYLVCLTAKDTTTGCTDTMCAYVTVASCTGLAANFNFITKSDTAVFTNTTSNPSGFPVSYTWSFGNGKTSSFTSPIHKYTKSGVYNVCLKAISNLGCEDSICKTVVITTPACSSFTANYTFTSGYAQTVTFNNTSTSTADEFYWNFGDASYSTSKNPVYQYSVAGTYNVCMVAIDTALGCIDTVCQSVTASACAAFTANFNYTLSNGTEVNFTNTSSSAANSFSWTFDDGNTSTGKHPFHNYAFTDTFNVCLIAKDTVTGCADTTCKNVVIVGCAHLTADFSIGKDSCRTVSFTNNSSGANATSWYFGDSNQIHYGFGFPYTTAHHYNASGNYTVCLVAKDTVNGCKDSTCNNSVVVGPGILGQIYRDSSWQIADSCIVYLIKVTIDTVANDTILTAVDSTYSNGWAGYMFSNVPYGDYLIKAALLPGSAFYANRIPTYYGNETQWRYAATVTVNSFCTWASFALTIGTNPGGSGFIGGYVSVGANKYGDPIPEVQVNLYNADESPFGYTYTDASGEYRFDNLLFGTYKVIVEVPGKPCQELWVSISQGSPSVTGLNYEVNTKDITLKLGGATGIEETGNGMFTVYPNPAGSYINIGYIAGGFENAVIEITDITGKTVMQTGQATEPGRNSSELDVSSLVNGVYIITVKTENNTYMSKLIINK